MVERGGTGISNIDDQCFPTPTAQPLHHLSHCGSDAIFCVVSCNEGTNEMFLVQILFD